MRRVSESADLPTDIEALHALVAVVRAERDARNRRATTRASQIDRLRHLSRQLQRAHLCVDEVDAFEYFRTTSTTTAVMLTRSSMGSSDRKNVIQAGNQFWDM